jgi:dihydroflavonol-4-reductase
LKQIGVTGAFGFLGASFVSALLDSQCQRGLNSDECRITAFASTTRSHPLFEASDVEIEALDVVNDTDMSRKFSGLDVVAHFAGVVDYSGRGKRRVWDANVLGTRRVFDAAIAAGVRRVCYVSSVCVLGAQGPTTARLLTESDAPYAASRRLNAFASPAEALDAVERSSRGDYSFLHQARVAYFDSKLAAWELARVYARERGLDIVTVFPGTAVGPGDLHYAISRLVDGVWDGRLGSSLEGATSFVDSRDFARGALLALSKGRAGEGYVISGRDEDNLRYAEFMSLVARVARENGGHPRKRPPRTAPRSLALAAATVADLFVPSAGLSPALVLSGTIRNVCSSAKARIELGYQPSPSLDPAILACRRFGEAARPTGRR